MSRQEIKAWAREKIKGEFWPLLGTILVASFLANFTISYPVYVSETERMTYVSISVGWLLYFIQVGLTYYLVKFILIYSLQLLALFQPILFGQCK